MQDDRVETENKDNCFSSSRELLKLFNKHAGENGGSVQLKRYDKKSGEYVTPESNQIDKLDSEFRIANTARNIQNFSREEKINWSIYCKKEGNKKFHEHNYEKAISFYMDSLVGLDYGDSDAEKKDVTESIKIPILLNLAACFFQLEKWRKVVSLCSEVLKFDEDCFKAYLRRGAAYTKLGSFSKAKTDLKKASTLGNVKREFRELQAALETERQHRKKEKKLYQRMINSPLKQPETENSHNETGIKETDMRAKQVTDEEVEDIFSWLVRIAKNCWENSRKEPYKFE